MNKIYKEVEWFNYWNQKVVKTATSSTLNTIHMTGHIYCAIPKVNSLKRGNFAESK